MTFEATRTDLTLGVIGAGVMGRGIAQVAAEAGITVLLADARPEAVAEAVGFCTDMIRRKAAKGSLTPESAEAAIGCLRATDAGPDRGYDAFASCHIVIEAVAERLDVKQMLIAALESVVVDDCILATNTSSLSVTAIAARARRPERVAGFHFFNPVPLMKLVEVIGGVMTDEGVLDALTAVAQRLGHRPVRVSDTPGFLVNHAGRAFATEALRIVSEGIADFADVDRVMVEAAGFRLGPFELLDLTGLDVSHAVMEAIYHQYYEEPRYRPVPIVAQRHAARLFGRKTGRGFYTYVDGRARKPSEAAVPQADLTSVRVWISNRHPDAADALRSVVEATGARMETGERPSDEAIIMLTPFGEDTTTAALTENLDPARSVAVDCLLGLDRRRTLMGTPITRPDMKDAAHALLATGNHPVTVIRDSPGFIAQRIIACIVNVGADIAQQRIAAPEDINSAVEIGLGYPRGSLRFGDDVGPRRILGILDACHVFYGDPRYRASPWLKRRALLGVPLTLPDA
ncbi:3-hydroxyacyl-CoA dehydrogenase [Microvirga makkahensis]|uniref:3-hydroxyacyl-CoA dehydrogenase n=1 Tax=Microvirga makkahensis TaxID=1128670 RepID=A0A7X3MP82_9HYPH|nr:3-hydroxyacyl-CoA dehydrogenase [Microvirga makkahensis]MXQ10642.1 3-hydroxyacyl-CoA dehydrogenase [Microvirga makkahensis]